MTEDQDGSDEGIDISGSQVPRSTTIRRSSMIKKKSDSTSDEQSPKDNPARLSFCKQTSRYAHELEQLAHAMHALSQWQTAERKFFER